MRRTSESLINVHSGSLITRNNCGRIIIRIIHFPVLNIILILLLHRLEIILMLLSHQLLLIPILFTRIKQTTNTTNNTSNKVTNPKTPKID